MKQQSTDILVCGGGTPGLALSLLLAKAGLAVTLVERGSLSSCPEKTMPDARTTALMQGSINILKQTGAWEAALPAGEYMKVLRIIDDTSAMPVSVDFEAGEIGLDHFGVNMPGAFLTAALAQTARKTENLRIMAPAVLSALEPDDFGITATIDGQPVRATLIVGADGRQSAIRALSKIGASTHDYNQHAICCLIKHNRPHHFISTEFHRPSGPFTLVPLPENTSSVVWVDGSEDAKRHMALNRRSFIQALQERSGNALGAIDLITPPSSWPLIRMKARNIIAHRVALVAEAAHVIHPLGAQGLNLSLRDVAALAETIIDAARLGQDPGRDTILKSYREKRAQDLFSRTAGTDLLNQMVSTRSSLLGAMRKSGLKTLDRLSVLKHLIMQEGLAPGLKDSRMARGGEL